jgi:hypothetical protein
MVNKDWVRAEWQRRGGAQIQVRIGLNKEWC